MKSLRSHTKQRKLPENHPCFPPGDGRYSLLGQPFQYNLSICPPLLHGQSAYTVHQVRVSPVSLRAAGVSFSPRPLLLSHHLSQLGSRGGQRREGGPSGRSLRPAPVVILLTLPGPGAGALYFSLAALWPVCLPGRVGSSGLHAVPESQTDWGARQSILFTWNESYLSNVEGAERIEARKPEQETGAQICLH